jgi:hypothetical protein
MGAMASGSAHPSCRLRSSAFRRDVPSGLPCGMSSRARTGRSVSPMDTGSSVFPQR